MKGIMLRPLRIILFCVSLVFFLLIASFGFGQKTPTVFEWFNFGESDSFRLTKPLRFYEILCSKTGLHRFSSSFGLIRDKGMDMEVIFYTWSGDNSKKLSRNHIGEDSIRTMYEGSNNIVFFASHDNRLFWQPSNDGGCGFTPFNFPPPGKNHLVVSKLWIDAESNIYIGTRNDNFYFIKQGAVMSEYAGGLDSAGNFIVKKGEKPVK